tara:strand:- start:355 stop:864 length:510 start_codon:yes stop_codon:yes gene_type:complete
VANYFQSFDLTPSFALDQAALEARYEQLMVLCHPDKFAGAAMFEQRAAAKRAADINEAYGVLRHAVRRAGHLLELRGVDIQQLERQPASPDFLFEQMMLRERVQDFESLTSTEASTLASDIESAYSETQNAFVTHYDRGDISGACAKWVEFHFQQKLLDELVSAQRQVA